MIEAKNERFWQCIDRNAKVDKVADGFGAADGPVFSRRGFLFFSDSAKNSIMRWERGKMSVYREKSNGARGLTFDHQGRLLACENGRVTRTEKNGSITVLAADGLQSHDDLVYAIDGSVYFTDSAKGRIHQVTRERGGVGGVAGKGTVKAAATDCSKPAGIAMGPNQQKLYVADRGAKVIREYAVAPDGSLKGSREFAKFDGEGLKTDESGNVWVAGADGVSVFDARGEMLGVVKTPAPPSNLNWGSGFRGLFITAGTGLYQVGTRSSGTRTF
jgi:gluconolactonase